MSCIWQITTETCCQIRYHCILKTTIKHDVFLQRLQLQLINMKCHFCQTSSTNLNIRTIYRNTPTILNWSDREREIVYRLQITLLVELTLCWAGLDAQTNKIYKNSKKSGLHKFKIIMDNLHFISWYDIFSGWLEVTTSSQSKLG